MMHACNLTTEGKERCIYFLQVNKEITLTRALEGGGILFTSFYCIVLRILFEVLARQGLRTRRLEKLHRVPFSVCKVTVFDIDDSLPENKIER